MYSIALLTVLSAGGEIAAFAEPCNPPSPPASCCQDSCCPRPCCLDSLIAWFRCHCSLCRPRGCCDGPAPCGSEAKLVPHATPAPVGKPVDPAPAHGPAAPPAHPAPSLPIVPTSATVAASNTAIIVIHLPEDARVFIDNVNMPSKSSRRVFESPKLEPEQTYTYTLKAEFSKAGKQVMVTKVVRVHAGARVDVSLGDDRGLATSARK